MKQTLLTASFIIAGCLWGSSAAQAAVVTGTYVATGSNQSINLGFQPEIVLVKDGSGGVTSPAASALQIRTVGMTLTKDFGQGAANDTTGTDRITALTATGFTIGTGATVNTTGRTYHYLAMDEVPGEIKVGSYVGNATDNRNITGVGFQPDFVLTMPDAPETSIWRNSSMVGDFSLNWTEIAEDDQIQSLAADGFQIGSRASVNANGTNFIYIACKNVAGNFKTGTYTGTGVAASISGMGFLPEALFIRRYNTVAPSVTGTYAFRSGGPNVSFLITATNSVADLITSLNPDGFSVGTATRVNTSAIQYYYFGWKGIPAGAVVSAPTVTSTAAASVMATTATLGGNITATGGEDATARGVVYALTSANANPEIGGASVTVLPESGTFSTGAFTSNATALTASSNYSFKAYATNSAGTSYGGALTFTTSAAPVSVTSLNRVNTTPSNAGTVNWTLTFGSAVTGVTASNFSLSGAGAIGASVGTPATSNAGLTWTVPVTTAADGTLTLSLANATGLSAPVGSLPYGGESYTIDKTAPTVLSVVRQTPSGQMTTATSVTFRVTYSEPVTGIAAARYQVVAVNGSNIIGTVAGVTPVSTSVYDVAVSITSGTGEFRLRVID